MGKLVPFVVLSDLFDPVPLLFLCLVAKAKAEGYHGTWIPRGVPVLSTSRIPTLPGWVHRAGGAQGSASGRGSSPEVDSAAWATLWDPLGAIQAQPAVGPPETSQPPYATASPPLTVRYTPTSGTTLGTQQVLSVG